MMHALPNPFDDFTDAVPAELASRFQLDERAFWNELQVMSDWIARQILVEEELRRLTMQEAA